ncbi:hypothetical protein BCAR13_440009 [Paraburkholderia caribensis]|nr:hypothetical protein BCAR13_440009 [Paraburkholderia caribensis]
MLPDVRHRQTKLARTRRRIELFALPQCFADRRNGVADRHSQSFRSGRRQHTVRRANEKRVIKKRPFETHADSDTLILPAHFPYPCAGFIRRTDTAYRYEFISPERILDLL